MSKKERGSPREFSKDIAVGAGILLLIGGCSTAFIGMYRHMMSSPGGNSPSAVAGSFTEAAYAGDYETIYHMLPESLQERSLADTKNLWEIEIDADALTEQGSSLMDYLHTLDACFGEGWSMDYAILGTEYFTPDELADVNAQLAMMGTNYKANKAARVRVQANLTGINGTTGDVDFYVPVYRSGIFWHLGQYIGEGAPDPDRVYSYRFGDLMDGFSIEGVFDSDGNILFDANGQQVQEGGETK